MSEGKGLMASLRQLLGTLTEIAATRLELLTNEWAEERLRLLRIFFYAFCAAISLAIACVLLVIFIIILFWNEHRLAALGLLTILFSLIGILSLFGLKSLLGSNSKLFSASLAELQQDYKQLHANDE